MCIGCAPGWVRPGRQRGRLDFRPARFCHSVQRAAQCGGLGAVAPQARKGAVLSTSRIHTFATCSSASHVAVRWWPCAVPRSCWPPGAGCESMLLRAPGREGGATRHPCLPAFCILRLAVLRPSIPHGVPGADAAAWSGDSVRRSCTYQIVLDELLK